jgi:hypothetical protein
MNVTDYAKKQLESGFSIVNMCLDGMDDAQFNFKPPGTANPPAKTAVHLGASLDFFINAALAGGQMQWPAVAAEYGLPANSMEIWKFDRPIPVAPVVEFNHRMQKMTLDYVSGLREADFDRVVETQFFGKQTVAFFLHLSTVHAVGHAGDIAAIKGLQGLKGLPF